MNQETIFVQTDFAFNIVLQSLTELRDQNRLQERHYQLASLTNIESNDPNEDRRFMFGGKAGNTELHFGRTASAVVRMCMLEATGVPQSCWPVLGPHTEKRNKAKLHNPLGEQRRFCLADNKDTARHYWSRYDQLYPHFRIQDAVRHVALNKQASISSMMLIFRGNFTEVIEITTTFNATPRGGQQFDSYIHVICIVRKISAPTEEGEDGQFTRRLKELIVPAEVQEGYFEEMTKVKKGTGLQQVRDAFAKLTVQDKNE